MRIVIDLQGAQSTGSARRGIGRYSRSLALAMARDPRSHEIVLALNSRFPDMAEELRAAFSGLVDANNIRSWTPPPFASGASAASRRATERLYEAFLASLDPDVVHVSSLFEGWDDAATASVGNLVAQPTAVTLYDLIPLVNADRYLADAGVRSWYMRKLDSLKRADRLLAISESSRREGMDVLGLAPERCINLSTAAYEHFKRIDISPAHRQALLGRFGLHRPFIMYTGGIDVRKNLDGLIRAYAALPSSLRQAHQLAIVCAAKDEEKKALFDLARNAGLQDGELVLTGFVPEEDLVAFYNLCQLFVFPSWHEGFGLPALEAMQCGAVVIGANTSSVPEVIGREDALFDPHDIESMARKMAQALSDVDFRRELQAHGLVQANRFSWEASAQRALDGLEALHERIGEIPLSVSVARKTRPRLAYLSPLPPDRSGIADYSAELLVELAVHYQIELVTPDGRVADAVLGAAFTVRAVDWFVSHVGHYDRVLYHMGNSEFHAHMFDLIERVPGVVVLHDFFLSGALAYMEQHLNQGPVWRQSLYRSHGYPALVACQASENSAAAVYKYPCNLAILQHADAVIVHSSHSAALAYQWYGERISKKFHEIAFPRAASSGGPARRIAARARLNLAQDAFIACAFGIVNPTKMNDRLVDCWEKSRIGQLEDSKLFFVGQNDGGAYGEELNRRIKGFKTGGISITGWTSPEVYQAYLEASDIAVQLRSLSRGETSAAVLDTMSRGLATIVNANGSMAAIQQDCVWMMPDLFDDAALVEALEILASDSAKRAEIGGNAKRIVATLHAPSACAAKFRELIEATAGKKNVRTLRGMVVSSVRDEDPLPQMSGPPTELIALSQAVSENLPIEKPSSVHAIDVTGLMHNDVNSEFLSAVKVLLQTEIDGLRFEPIYWCDSQQAYRCAQNFAFRLLALQSQGDLPDNHFTFDPGDRLLVLDIVLDQKIDQQNYLRRIEESGVRIERIDASQLTDFAKERDDDPTEALAVAGIRGLAHADFNHLLHYLRGAELSQLPKAVDCFVSVGCAGTGYFEWIRDLCAPRRHVGIEFYSPMPHDLPANVEWIANTAGDMSNIADGVADVLFSGQNIEHLWPHDIVAFLRESRRVLKPSALLVVDSPNRLITSLLGWSHPEHVLEFTPDEVSELARAAGFDVVALRGAWACYDAKSDSVIPLTQMNTNGRWSVAERIDHGAKHPQDAFSWWLEARRSERAPDWQRVEQLVERAFSLAWPDRVNRMLVYAGASNVVDGVQWVYSSGLPGLIMGGPSMPLPAGRYQVEVEIRPLADVPANDSPFAALHAIAGNGTQLGAAILNCDQIKVEGTMVRVVFDLGDTTFGISYRLIALGATALACRRGVALTCLTDARYSAPAPAFHDNASSDRALKKSALASA